MTAYYNENEPYCAAWLRNLIAANLIAPGDVDERDIRDVIPTDLALYTQCHFFAGIGGWSRALRLAAWPDHRPVWTGSCPCQPFSAAGKRGGFADERHLWPHWFHLISQCRPAIIFGEQVARAKIWIDLVHSDMEGLDYAFGAAVLPACSVGAEHERQRWWWVASDAYGKNEFVHAVDAEMETASSATSHFDQTRLSRRRQTGTNVAHAAGIEAWNGFEHDIARCVPRDDWAYQPVLGSGIHGISGRVGQVGAFGNAIVPQVATQFIIACEECRP
jgi:DNA (cytosine-5)-methyltransferase 1